MLVTPGALRFSAASAAVDKPTTKITATLANAAGLTRREQEVLVVLAHGATNFQIAAALHLSERTVAHHVSSILGKLSAPTRTAAVEAPMPGTLASGARRNARESIS